MSKAFQPRKPQFKLGHRVVVTVSGTNRDKQGIVMEVMNPGAGNVYRYRVLFPDGAQETFFGFELALRDAAL